MSKTSTSTAAAVTGTGNALNNVITGNGAANQLFGGGGNDTLNGDDGNDLLDGGTGDDTLSGGDDNDTIIGGDGNDTIDVGGGFNTIVYNSANFGNDTINSFDAAGGTPANQDRIDLSASGSPPRTSPPGSIESRVRRGNTAASPIRETAPGIGQPIGTIRINGVLPPPSTSPTSHWRRPRRPHSAPRRRANTITGNAAAKLINGLGGNDTVNGAGGNDVVNGGEGADTLNGGDGNDTLTGGPERQRQLCRRLRASVLHQQQRHGRLHGSWIEQRQHDSPTGGDIRSSTVAASTSRRHRRWRDHPAAFSLAGATAAICPSPTRPTLDAGETVIVEACNARTQYLADANRRTFGGDSNGAFNSALDGRPDRPELRDPLPDHRRRNNWDNGENFYDRQFVGQRARRPASTPVWTRSTAMPATTRSSGTPIGGADRRPRHRQRRHGRRARRHLRHQRQRHQRSLPHLHAAAWMPSLATTSAGFNAATEIVITRNGTDWRQVIAELSEIEEIRINGVDPSGTGGAGAGDTFQSSATSPAPACVSTPSRSMATRVTTRSISRRSTSAHRIVFKSNGGNDTIIGALQAEDVIELPEGADPLDLRPGREQDGTKTISNGTHSVTFTGVVPPQFLTDEPGERRGRR